MPKIAKAMVRLCRKGGKVCITEMSTQGRNNAEEVYIRLHKESGDCLFKSKEILDAMTESGLRAVHVKRFSTDIWFSPSLARQDLSFAQVWFDSKVEKSLGRLVGKYGMKYPEFLIFSGQK
jgi:ubiquinone/menaquinone biosynthesis C-methylase UbiE